MEDIHLQIFPELGGNKKRQQRSLKLAAGGWDTARHYKMPTVLGALFLSSQLLLLRGTPGAGAPDLSIHSTALGMFWLIFGLVWCCELPGYSVIWSPSGFAIALHPSHETKPLLGVILPFSGVCSPSCTGFAVWSPAFSPQSLSALMLEISHLQIFSQNSLFLLRPLSI